MKKKFYIYWENQYILFINQPKIHVIWFAFTGQMKKIQVFITLASQIWNWQFKPWTLCGKVGSFLPVIGSLQYRTLTNCMIALFPLPT